MKNIIVLLALFSATVFAQQKSSFNDSRDGKVYKAVKIGTQTWMAENLNYDAEGSKCYGEGSKAILADEALYYCDKYGRLYYWATAMKVCPSGWHLPTHKEWTVLIKFAGGEKIAGKKLKATNGWEGREASSGNGTDDYGFAALPGGYGYYDPLHYVSIGAVGYWWTATNCTTFGRGTKACSSDNNAYWWKIHGYFSSAVDYAYSPFHLYSVRCVMDARQ